MKYFYSLSEQLKFKKTATTECWQGCEEIGSSYIAIEECKNGTVTLEKSLTVSLKTKHAVTITSSNSTLGYLSQRNNTSC